MERAELGEWIAMILVILAWWPRLFGWFPLPYRVFVYALSAAVVTIVFVRRLRRVREGLRYSQEILESQRNSQPPPPLGDKLK